MSALIQLGLRLVAKNLVSLLVIIVVLMAGSFAMKELTKYNSAADVLNTVKRGQTGLLPFVLDKERDVSARIASLENASLQVLQDRINALDKEIKQKSADRFPPDVTLCLLRGGTSCDRYFLDLRVAAELNLLGQERDYLKSAYAFARDKNALALGRVELERLRNLHVIAFSAHKEKKAEEATLKEARSPLERIYPWSQANQELRAVERDLKELFAKNQRAYEAWLRQKTFLDTIKIPTQLQKFAVHRDQLNSEIQKLTGEVAELEMRYKENWVVKVQEITAPFVLPALGILLLTILTPIALKGFLYFVIAPQAAGRPPVRLMPDKLGTIEAFGENANRDADRIKVSAVSQPITIDQTQELLIHPEYLQSSAHRGEKDTKWLLDYSYPLSSLASGMYGLTRIRTPSSDLFVISSTADPFSEVGVISLPQDSAVVLQPHNLIGIVQNRNRPLEITRHWRLGSLQAWLTLQLRFLVFHGPAQLIVTGCRGVRVEKSGTGRSVNQAATIGFSANLDYSNTRCETFGSYLMGKQELFNDKFDGGPGFYIYEEMPHFGKKTGITGRGIEGVLDSVLKVFGI